MAKKSKQIVDLSIFTIIKFFLVVIAIVFLYIIKDVLAILFVSLILAAAFDSWVDFGERYKFPRWLSILFIYIGLFLVLFFAVYLIIPPIITQSGQLATSFPQYFKVVGDAFSSIKDYSISHGADWQGSIDALRSNLMDAARQVFSTVFSVFGGIVSFLIILVLTFYMTVEENAIKRAITFFLPDKLQTVTMGIINKVQGKIGAWLKGQLILCLIIGVLSYVGLLILGVDYALLLALLACIGEIIPYVGPVLSAVPAVFLAFVQSPIKAVFVLILYVIIQQLENHLLVPKVMQKAVGLNPIISIVALLLGVKLAGFIGVVLAIPVATALSVVVHELLLIRDNEEAESEK